MGPASWKRIVVAGLTLVAVGAIWLASASQRDARADSPPEHTESRRSYFRNVDLSDPQDVRWWAEAMSAHETLAGFAKAAGTPPDVDALVGAVARGFPPEARTIVREVFKKNLT
jgi:hypothetical protein